MNARSCNQQTHSCVRILGTAYAESNDSQHDTMDNGDETKKPLQEKDPLMYVQYGYMHCCCYPACLLSI